MGLAESAAEFFPDAAWQRCVVHWYRNIFSHVPSTKVREIAAMLKAIHAGERSGHYSDMWRRYILLNILLNPAFCDRSHNLFSPSVVTSRTQRSVEECKP
jgi:hypothetical protein